jgi:hypothetical protein
MQWAAEKRRQREEAERRRARRISQLYATPADRAAVVIQSLFHMIHEQYAVSEWLQEVS